MADSSRSMRPKSGLVLVAGEEAVPVEALLVRTTTPPPQAVVVEVEAAEVVASQGVVEKTSGTELI